jgi:TRAP-type mannitol/chloroaromatic compound transport system permease large subunit
VLADQLGRSVGDMYAGALLPGLSLVGLYLLFIVVVAFVKPKWVPALPPEARIYSEPNGSSGHRSLLVLLLVCGGVAFAWSQMHASIMNPLLDREMAPGRDEVFILSTTIGAFLALGLALANKLFGIGLLSRLTERVTFVLIPPLVLIFLVLGTIFLGIATPTEGGAMGALGALLMAAGRRTLSFDLLKQALENSTKLSIFVMFILIGSTVFSFTFNAADGHIWVEHLFDKLPGGQLGFLLFVNLLVFVLGMFIDFFEIAFIVVPLLVPVATKLDINLIWFGIILAMNLQTSFLTPPFGFALFYLRSVAARSDYDDVVTGERIKAVTTGQIYKGSIAFIFLQLIMVTVIVLNPGIVTGNLDKPVVVDENAIDNMLENMPGQDYSTPKVGEIPPPRVPLGETPSTDPAIPMPETGDDKEAQDALKALEEAVKPAN